MFSYNLITFLNETDLNLFSRIQLSDLNIFDEQLKSCQKKLFIDKVLYFSHTINIIYTTN